MRKHNNTQQQRRTTPDLSGTANTRVVSIENGAYCIVGKIVKSSYVYVLRLTNVLDIYTSIQITE